MRTVIAGGHGQIALRLERLLAARGDTVAGLIRNPAQADDLAEAGAEPIVLDLELASADSVAQALRGADAAVFAAEGREIPLKYRELMALAVALTTQCGYCIDFHANAAVKAGASDTELAETGWVATAIRAGGGYAHGRLAFKLAGVDLHAH